MSEKIPKGWKWVKLGEVGIVITGKTPSSKHPEDWGYDMPFVTPTDYRNYRKFAYDSERYLSNAGINKLKNKVLPENSVLVTCIGSDMGKVVINKLPVITNQQINSIIPNRNIIFPDFLYYVLVYNYETLRIFASNGTAVPILNKTDFENIEISTPPLPEQKAIAEVLSSIDDKIDLLHRQNKTLEEMAMTLFRQWFIEPTKDGLPEGWDIGKFEENLKIVYGKNLPTSKLQDSGYPVFGANGKIGYYIEYMYEEPQVLISCRGTAGKVNISDPKSYITNNSFVLEKTINENISFEYLKYYCLNYDFTQFVTGSVQPQITIEELNNAEILIPPNILINKFSKIISNFETKIFSNKTQIQTLEKIRDTLLPKLMSGEAKIMNNE